MPNISEATDLSPSHSLEGDLPAAFRALLRPRAAVALAAAVQDGPRVIREMGIKLKLEEAELLCELLAQQGISARPYDFPGTIGVWSGERGGVPYYRLATREMVDSLARALSVDATTVPGFGALLQHFTIHSFSRAINAHGTPLRGMLFQIFRSSPSAAILDLVNHDPAFHAIKAAGVSPLDFPLCPRSYWRDSAGRPTATARAATRLLLEKLARTAAEAAEAPGPRGAVDVTKPEGFKRVLGRVDWEAFHVMPVSPWGATLGGMSGVAYCNSPARAVLDLVENDPAFAEVRAVGLANYDFPKVRAGTRSASIEEDECALVTRRVLELAAEEAGVDCTTVAGFRTLLPRLSNKNLEYRAINYWGTTADVVYRRWKTTPAAEIMNLVNQDPAFHRIAAEGLEPSDLMTAPQGWWLQGGKPTEAARRGTAAVLMKLGQLHEVDPCAVSGFRAIIPHIGIEAFSTITVNIWGTTMLSMLHKAYETSPGKAVCDLVEHDPKFVRIREAGLAPYDFQPTPRNTWHDANGKPTQYARRAVQLLVEKIAMSEGVDWRSPEGFAAILPKLTGTAFEKIPINVWGTTLSGLLQTTYSNRPSEAIIDLLRERSRALRP